MGNVTGAGTYSSNDAGKLLNVSSGADAGFAMFPALDPAIVGDLNGNGAVDAGDAVQLNIFNASGSNPAFVPAYPGVTPSVIFQGPDPTLSIPPVSDGQRRWHGAGSREHRRSEAGGQHRHDGGAVGLALRSNAVHGVAAGCATGQRAVVRHGLDSANGRGSGDRPDRHRAGEHDAD